MSKKPWHSNTICLKTAKTLNEWVPCQEKCQKMMSLMLEMSYRNNIEKPIKKANGNQKKETVNEDKYVLLKKNVTIYKNEENFSVETAEAAENNERTWIFILDEINLKIMEELLNNGDIKSSEIALKLGIPLSTIQRRRSKIEKTIFRKTYEMDLVQLGFRTALIFVDIQKGKAKETGEKLRKRYDKYIIRASTRINSSNNLCLEIVYNNSKELHFLLEEIKGLPLATSVDWSEQVYLIGDNVSNIINFILSTKVKELRRESI